MDTRYQSGHMGPQPIQVNFKNSAAVADVICHALVLTRKFIIVTSDGNKMVEIISERLMTECLLYHNYNYLQSRLPDS